MAQTQSCILITGAAVRVGAAIAEDLAAQGHALVLHYHRSQAEAESLAQRLRTQYGVEVALATGDLSDTKIADDFFAALPPCHGLIHNASLFARDQLATMRADDLRKHLAVNFQTPLLLTQAFMRQLPPGAAGNVIVLGDGVMGWSVSPQFFSYAISKQAWLGALDVLAAACAPRARVNMLALAPTLPGPTDSEGMFDRLAARAPLQRTSSVAEVCDAVRYLLAAPGVTGQVLSLAGGIGLASARPPA